MTPVFQTPRSLHDSSVSLIPWNLHDSRMSDTAESQQFYIMAFCCLKRESQIKKEMRELEKLGLKAKFLIPRIKQFELSRRISPRNKSHIRLSIRGSGYFCKI